jgi:hypothetical protein
MFKIYEVVAEFALEGITTPFHAGDFVMLPVSFAGDLIEKGNIKEKVD